MSELAVIKGGGSPLAISAEQEDFNQAQIDALKAMNGWGEVPGAELSVFLHHAQRTGLDPFTKQIYLIGRYSKKKNRTEYTIQVGIDGLRLVADRTGAYAGNDAPVFWEDDYGWYCQVTVYKFVQGIRCPFTQRVYKKDYADERSPLWNKWRMMLAKCAEAASLRKGFPADLSGLYIHEEMHQAGRPAVPQSVGGSPKPAAIEPRSEDTHGPVPDDPIKEIEFLYDRLPGEAITKHNLKKELILEYARKSPGKAHQAHQRMRYYAAEAGVLPEESAPPAEPAEKAPPAKPEPENPNEPLTADQEATILQLTDRLYDDEDALLEGSEWYQQNVLMYPIGDLSRGAAEMRIRELEEEGAAVNDA